MMNRLECTDCGSETEFIQFADGSEETVETNEATVGDGLLELRYCGACKSGFENVLRLDSQEKVR